MRERLDRLVGKERLAELTVGTFHAFCARLLRREGPTVGIDRSFAIYDEADQRAVLRQAMTNTNASERIFHPGAIATVISGAKNELKGPADLAASPKGQLDRIAAIVWKRYDELLRENNAVDFDDLLLLACRLFETSDRALEKWQDRYQHILVDESHEAELVAREIERLQREGEAHGTRDVAVLYRTNAQSRAIEDKFRAFGLAYQIVGGVSFYQRREVKDTLAYLRLIRNPHDAFALARVLNTPPRGLGDKTRAALLATAREHEMSVGDALTKADLITSIPKRQQDALVAFGRVMTKPRGAAEQLALPRLLDEVTALTGYEAYLKDGTEEGEERWANVQELRTLAEEFTSLPQEEQLPSFLEQIALVSDVDEYQDAKPSATLITMHAVKGLEFPIVFMTGMEEGVFPHARAIESGSEAELEEERRLCYVGITRAKDRAYLTYARRRSLFGRTNMNPPSRFLMELPSEGVELRGGIETEERDTWAELDWERDRVRYEERKQARRDERLAGLPSAWTGPATRARTATPTETRFRARGKVRHPVVGEGMVVSSVARDDDEEVTVAFPDRGVKKLMASFAKLGRA